MNRRSFLLGTAAALAIGACSDIDDVEDPVTDEVRLRTVAALSLAAAAKSADAAAMHRAHADLLDPAVTTAHRRAVTTWSNAVDAELALAATCQAWTPMLSTSELRQRLMAVGGAVARRYTVAAGGTLPEAFQLVDPAVPDGWLLR